MTDRLTELHEGVAQIVRVWAHGHYFACSYDVQANGELVLRLKAMPEPPAGFEVGANTDERVAELLHGARVVNRTRAAESAAEMVALPWGA